MNHDHYEDTYIETILSAVKTIAIIGASPKQVRPSFSVLKYFLSKGFDAIPVNPGHAGRLIADAMTYASLTDNPRPIDMIDVFRNSDAVLPIVEEALKLNPLPKVIWMQLEIQNEQAAALAQANGIKVVMNRCAKIEHARYNPGDS